jgi:hypothetical protein
MNTCKRPIISPPALFRCAASICNTHPYLAKEMNLTT